MKTWYYKLENEEIEITEEKLLKAIEQGALPKEILIRDESMSIWVKASSIDGLLPLELKSNEDDVPENIVSYILGIFFFIFWLLSGAAPQSAFLLFGFFLILYYIDIPRFKKNFKEDC